jgi:MoaA/NifB/PqqE/SkfB family radical SAM enzyme
MAGKNLNQLLSNIINSMKRLYFASLSQCNENCLFCVRGGDEPPIDYMSTVKAKKILKDKRREGYEEIYFDGGEPTIRKDLPELIMFAKKEGYRAVNIMTNATLLSEIELVRKLLKIKNTKSFTVSFSVSLHSHKKDISEKLVDKKNTFNKTIKGIANLIKSGAQDVSIYHVITKYNFNNLPNFVNFVHKKFPEIKNITFSFIYPAGAALKNKKIYPPLSKIEPFFKKAADLCQKYGIDFSLSTCGTVPLCFLRGYEEVLLKQQELDQPERVGLVDAKKDTQYQLATKDFHKKTKIKSSKCSRCIFDDKCGGIWRTYVEMYGIDELKPVLKKRTPQAENPTVMLLLTGFSCNNNCVFCSNVADRDFNSSSEELFQKIKDGYKRGFRVIEFLGGEVTIRPDFFELLSFAKKTGFKDIRLTTNGRLFSYPGFAQKVKDAGMSVMVFSVYGHNKLLHEAVTRSPGSFEQCIQGIKNVKKIGGIDVVVNTVVSKINYKNLYEIGDFVSSLGVTEWHPLELLPDGRGEKQYDILGVPYGELSPSMKKAARLAGKQLDRIDFFDFPFCVFDKESFKQKGVVNIVTPKQRFEDMEMNAPDESFRVEKLKEGDEVVYQDKYKIKPGVCKKCEYFYKCGGVARPYYKKYKDSEIKVLMKKHKLIKHE